MTERVEDVLKRITGHKGVLGVIIVNAEGIPVYTSLDNSTTNQYIQMLRPLVEKARSSVRDVDPTNDLDFLRVQSRKTEILVCPDSGYIVVVIQQKDSSQ